MSICMSLNIKHGSASTKCQFNFGRSVQDFSEILTKDLIPWKGWGAYYLKLLFQCLFGYSFICSKKDSLKFHLSICSLRDMFAMRKCEG